MSNQEVWVTLRIKSELPVEIDAPAYARTLAKAVLDCSITNHEGPIAFFWDASEVTVMEVMEEGHIYGTREDKPYRLEE